MATRKPSGDLPNPRLAKKHKPSTEDDDPPPKITSTFHRRTNLLPASHHVSNDRKLILADLMTFLQERRDDINRRTAEMASAPATKKLGYAKGIDVCKRYMGIILGAIGFAHIMEEETVKLQMLFRTHKPSSFASQFVEIYGRKGCEIMNYWDEKGPIDQDLPSGERSNHATNAQQLIGRWYARRCILTWARYGDACHIIPDCVERTRNSRAFATFWEALSIFWDENEIAALKEFISDPDNMKRNLVVFSKDVHVAWSKHLFILTPQGNSNDDENPDSLTLLFRHVRKPRTAEEGVEFARSKKCNPMVNMAAADNGDVATAPAALPTIETGDEFELRTVDPDQCPLPLRKLFAISGALAIATAASAAADVINIMFGKKDDPDADARKTKKASMIGPILDPNVWEEDVTLAFPNFMKYLITSAVEWGTISNADEVHEWTKALIPDQHISPSTEGD